MPHDIVLVSMPWCSLYNPSIQIGVLAAALREQDIDATCRSYQIDFCDWLTAADTDGAAGFSVAAYLDISVEGFAHGMGDWTFAQAAFGDKRQAPDPAYLEMLSAAGFSQATLNALRHARRHAEDFVSHCADEVLAQNPRMVGFTTGFQQTIASLAVARLLKARAPDVRIVFGGSDCDGDMGAGLIRAFPFLDAIVRGEGEKAITALARDALAGRPVQSFPGLCYREDGAVRLVTRLVGGQTPPDTIPTPDFDDYFARLHASANRSEIEPAVEMPIESSRGCWWGEKHHCTFCGFNGAEMKFRSRSADRFLTEVHTLTERHKCHNLMATDAIIDPKYFSTVLPVLADSDSDLAFFYETKANLKEKHIDLMRMAGIVHLQPGIESLSTPILKMMKKGTTSIQNIRVLKWCRQYGINALWNIIYGFPGEDPEEYAKMARLAPALAHLQPPSLVPLVLDRFSPYQMRPADHGIEIVGPPRHYPWTMSTEPAVAAEWENLCYRFEHRHCDGRDPESYVGGLRDVIGTWHDTFSWEKPALCYQRGPGFLTIYDRRPDFAAARYKFESPYSDIYLACNEGASPAQIAARLGFSDEATPKLRSMLNQFSERGLVIEEDDIFLSLAIPVGGMKVPYPATM
jgi:ribosomal peptide maturation radical SAM protein 1